MQKKQNKKWFIWLGATAGVLAGVVASIVIWKKKQKKELQFHSELLASSAEYIGNIKFHKGKVGHHGNFQWQRFFREQPVVLVIILLIILSIVFQSSIEKYSLFFKASLLELNHVPFDGTVNPVEKVPNWVLLTDAERKARYDQIPQSKLINTPEYNISKMKSGTTWTPDNELERNTYITYPVPYMGNYKLDASENSGSHLGVDIKIPVGTPIHSIANGVVTKSENQPTGFGLHIVIAHVGVPDPDNVGRTTTLYSAYAHMSELKVKVGQQVRKGEIIGYSGNSGMTTAPHLHFQIDTQDAPFHPYWPFSWSDLQAKSINSYFDGVKYGVGKEVALKYTVNPINFSVELANYKVENSDEKLVAMAWLDPAPSADINLIDTTKEEVKPITEVTKEEIKKEETPLKIDDATAVSGKPVEITMTPTRRSNRPQEAEFKVGDRVFVPGKEKQINFWVDDKIFEKGDTVEFESTLGTIATVVPISANKNDFVNGGITLTVKTDSDSTFKLLAKGAFGEIKSTSLQAQIFQDVPRTHPSFAAIKYLKDESIVKGYEDGSFKPDGTLNRAEAVKMLVEAFKITEKEDSVAFTDINGSEWFAAFVKKAASNNLVKGYEDGSFKPENTITKAEFLTIAIRAAKREVPKATKSYYTDVPLDSWFSDVFAYAKENDLIEKGESAKPHYPITREEAAIIIYELVKIASVR